MESVEAQRPRAVAWPALVAATVRRRRSLMAQLYAARAPRRVAGPGAKGTHTAGHEARGGRLAVESQRRGPRPRAVPTRKAALSCRLDDPTSRGSTPGAWSKAFCGRASTRRTLRSPSRRGRRSSAACRSCSTPSSPRTRATWCWLAMRSVRSASRRCRSSPTSSTTATSGAARTRPTFSARSVCRRRAGARRRAQGPRLRRAPAGGALALEDRRPAGRRAASSRRCATATRPCASPP